MDEADSLHKLLRAGLPVGLQLGKDQQNLFGFQTCWMLLYNFTDHDTLWQNLQQKVTTAIMNNRREKVDEFFIEVPQMIKYWKQFVDINLNILQKLKKNFL